MRCCVFVMQKYLKRVTSSFLRIFHLRPVSSGSELAINACILMSFGIECGTTCVAGAVVEIWEAETVDVPATDMFCEDETVIVPVTAALC